MSTLIQIRGEKRGSKIWIHNGKGYIKERETQRNLFLRFRQFKKDNCKGRAAIRTDVDLIIIKNAHSDDCCDSAEVFDVIDLKSSLKRKAENSSASLRQIFNDGVEDSPVADQINYLHLIDSMNKRRRLMTPPLPQTPMEASHIVASDIERYGKHFYDGFRKSVTKLGQKGFPQCLDIRLSFSPESSNISKINWT